MHYCGITLGPDVHQLCVLQELRVAEPPIRLGALFYEPGAVEQVIAAVEALSEPVVAIAAPTTEPLPGRPIRLCDAELQRRGVSPQTRGPAGPRLAEGISALGIYAPGPVEGPLAEGDPVEGPVADGTFRSAAAFETNVDGVFCALQGRRVPARRHPLGVQRRIEELVGDQVVDEGGDLWHRRIEEIEAAAAALAAHRYAVGHASWLGDPYEGVVVLPGSEIPPEFTAEGVIPPVERLPLP